MKPIKRWRARVAAMAGMSLLVAASTISLAADKTNFSGTYLLQRREGNAMGSGKSKLRVVQNDQAIEVTRVEAHRRSASRFPLSGEEGDYTSPAGVPGKGKAQFKGSDLLLDSEVMTSPHPGAPPVRTHTRELWQLSPDSKILTIRFDVDFRVGLGQTVNQSWTEIYARVRNR